MKWTLKIIERISKIIEQEFEENWCKMASDILKVAAVKKPSGIYIRWFRVKQKHKFETVELFCKGSTAPIETFAKFCSC